MSLADDLAADLAAGIADHEQTMEWNGATYPCVRNPEPFADQPAEGGEIQTLAERIVVARTAFTGPEPQIGDAIDEGASQIKMIETSVAHLTLHVDSFDK